MRSGLQVEIDLAGHPVVEAHAGRGVGEDRRDAGAALDLAIDVFEAVRALHHAL